MPAGDCGHNDTGFAVDSRSILTAGSLAGIVDLQRFLEITIGAIMRIEQHLLAGLQVLTRIE